MTTTHANEVIEKNKELKGNSRKGGDAPPEVQQKIIDIIIEEARSLKFDNRDIAYYVAIAKRESGFNPDAANSGSTASGIAQVIDKTAATYGVNDTNRFDARASIKAGLGYFSNIKRRIERDYGTAANDAEPMVYFLYHYGEYFHYNDRVKAKDPKPLSELKSDSKYVDSRTVVDEAARIEKILNDMHGLQVQLTDILGKPMSGRKVIIVQKKLNPASKIPSPIGQTNIGMPAESVSRPAINPPSTDLPSEKIEPANDNRCDFISTAPVEWDLVAFEAMTDSAGHIPEITTETQEPFLVLIPRIDYEAYNEAVMKQLMCESGNRHEIHTRDGEQGALPSISTQEKAQDKKSEISPTKPKTASAPTNQKSSGFTGAAEQVTKEKENPPSIPSKGSTITFADAAIALQEILGWKNVYESSFSYIKQFYTRPKLPATPLNEATTTKKSEARTQVIGSSLKNDETKSTRIKDKVTTAKETAIKDVKVVGEATWMTIALEEQTKDVNEIEGDQLSDTEWKKEHEAYKTAESALKSSKKQLLTQNNMPEKKKDLKKIKELQEEISIQEAAKNKAAKNMEKIEAQYNDQNILKYLKSAKLGTNPGSPGTRDATAWCASFVNWCLQQEGFVGPKDAGRAESWKNWGQELSEPKYGAITVVTRGVDKYHVGFYTGIVQKNVRDGEEEIEIKGKNGALKKIKRPKIIKVDHVRLLSGNMSFTIKEYAEWKITGGVKHLVSYRWPTDAEKEKK